MGLLEGKVALVTGGTRGIGLGCVRAFLEEGAAVAFCGRLAQTVDEVSRDLNRAGFSRHLGVVADVVRHHDVRLLVERVEKEFAGLDVLVNNAGVGAGTRLAEISLEEWDRILNTNLRGAFLLCQACYPLLKRRGGGAIVNISSVAGQTGGLAAGVHYAASKAGLLGLTKSLATQLAADHIRVNALAPADIETDMTASWPESLRETLLARTPLRRFGSVDEVVRAVVFLASDQSSFVTGETLNVNGGLYMP